MISSNVKVVLTTPPPDDLARLKATDRTLTCRIYAITPIEFASPLASTTMWLRCAIFLLAILAPSLSRPYDPEDGDLKNVLPSSGQFEAFYPREAHGIPNGSSRPAHGHGSFYKHRNPALIDVKNAAAYGFRFDGMRRFNFDDE